MVDIQKFGATLSAEYDRQVEVERLRASNARLLSALEHIEICLGPARDDRNASRRDGALTGLRAFAAEVIAREGGA